MLHDFLLFLCVAIFTLIFTVTFFAMLALAAAHDPAAFDAGLAWIFSAVAMLYFAAVYTEPATN